MKDQRSILACMLMMVLVTVQNVEAKPLTLPSAEADFVLTPTPSERLGKHDQSIGIKKGTKVPAFTLQSVQGDATELSTLLQQGPLMVVFYRGGWCPYCNLQIRDLTKQWSEFQQRGVTPVLISADSVDAAALASNTYRIPFPVMSDSNLSAHEAFDVVLTVDDATYTLYQSYGIELEQWSGKDHHKIAVASVFLVDKQGVVQWAHTSTDYKARPTTSQLLTVIDAVLP